MNTESLPKILFLHENSEQMNDRRIRSKVQYDTSGETPVKKVTKKINNTIDLTQNLHKDYQINRLAYSSKHGVMITCTDEQILLTDFQKIQSYLATPDTNKKSLKQISMAIKFSGKVYLTPDESKFLAVNKQELMLFDISTLSPLTKAQNQHSIRHFVFVNNQIFVGWNFQSQAYVYDNIQSKFGQNKKLQNIQKCTSINVINNHILACEKVNQGADDEDTKVFVFDETGSQIKNEISLRQFQNADNYIFNFTQILSIFPIKQEKQGQFSKNDTYGLILGFYDDQEYQPDRRYLNFLKGDLLTKDSKLSIRAFQLFLSPTEDRSFYYNENQQKIPFEVQIFTSGQIKIIMIEKLQVVFVVDCTQQFQKLNLYTLQPANQIKLQDNKYFQGICLMKNMLETQRKPPSKDSNQICDMICKQFNGQFLSLYFSAKQTQLTVPFPASVLVLGDNKIMRRYAVSTTQSVEEYEVDKLRQALNKIKTSNYIETVKSPVKISFGQSVGMQKKSQQKVQVKEEKKKPEGLFGQGLNVLNAPEGGLLIGQKPTIQQPKPASPLSDIFNKASQQKSGFSLFNQQTTQTKPTSDGNIFEKLAASNKDEQTKNSSPIFGNTQPQQSTGRSLFANLSKQQQAPVFGGVFDKKPTQEKKSGSLFEQKPDETKKQTPFTGGMLGTATQNKSPIFSQPQQSTSLFGQTIKKQQQKSKQPQVKQTKQQPKQDKKPSVLLFGNLQTPASQQKQPVKVDQKKQEKKQQTKPLTGGGLFAGQSKPFVLTVGTTPTNNALFGQQQPPKPQGGISFDAVSMFNKKAPVSQPVVKVDQKSPLKTNQKNQKNKSQVKLNVQQQDKKQLLIKQQKPVQNLQKPIQLKSQVSVPSKQEQTKSATVQKLEKLAQLMGFSSIQLIPSPLRLLTVQQADALILSLQNMAKPKQQPKKLTPQQQARQKLLKKEHFGKIVQQIDQSKDYLKRVKQANNMITSNKIFSLKNVKQLLLRQKPVLREKSEHELKQKNQLVNVVKDYVKKMELFARYQLQLQRQSLNHNSRQRNSVQDKRQFIENRVQLFEQHINRLTYYQQVVYPQDVKLWGVTNKDNNNKLSQQERWVQIGKKKITSSQQLIQKAQRLLSLTSKSQLLLAPTINNNNKGLNKSASVATNLSSRQENKKKKGHFAFTVESSQSSGNQQHQPIISRQTNSNKNNNAMKKSNIISYTSVLNNNNYNNNYRGSKKRTKMLIRVKPQSIMLSPDITTPLIVLPSTSTSPLYVPQQFNPVGFFKQAQSQSIPQQQQQPLQSSIKKPVNFSERIPLKKDQVQIKKSEIKATKTIRFDQSRQLQNSDQQQNNSGSQEQLNVVTNIGRSLSKFPQKNNQLPLISQQKQQPQKQQTLSIKKTFQKQLPSSSTQTTTKNKPKDDNKKDLAKQTKQAASAFTQAQTTLNNVNKKQQKVLSQKNIPGTTSLFNNPSTQQNKSLQKIQQTKPTDSKKQQPKKQTAPTSLFGAASGAASLFTANNNNKPAQQKKPSTTTIPSTTTGLFGAKLPQSTTLSSVGGLFGNLNVGSTTKQQQQRSKQNIPIIPDAKKQQSQTSKQQKSKKQQPPKQQKSLFANISTDNKSQSLFGATSSSAFTFANKSIPQKPKDQEQKSKPVTNAVDSDIKAAQKAAGQKKQTKPATSLFGTSIDNKGSLFANGAGGLFNKINKAEQTNKQNKQTKPQNKQPLTDGGLFAPKTDDTLKTKNQAGQQVENKPQEKKQTTSLFGNKTTTTAGNSLFGNVTPSVAQQQQSTQQTPVQQPTQPLFGQNKPTFGAQNRFMTTNTQQQQPSQPQQTTGFNPTVAAFTPPSNAFGNTGAGMKSFANFGGDNTNTTGIFGQQQQTQNPLATQQQQQTNPLQSSAMFGQNTTQNNPLQQQSTLFGNTQQNTLFGNTQQSSMFTTQPQPQQNTGMFGQQQNTGMFGQAAQGANTNFLAGFNPSGGMGVPTTAPTSNQMMFKPRK